MEKPSKLLKTEYETALYRYNSAHKLLLHAVELNNKAAELVNSLAEHTTPSSLSGLDLT